MLKRFFVSLTAVLLACLLLFSLLPHLGRPYALDTHDNTAEEWERVIAYVPLDDRTDNVEDVLYLAEASGYRVLLPEGDVYATRLDGQPLNRNGTPHGDREALFTWVREMDAQGCDLFLLSLDQLCSGGLVSSRAMSENEVLHFPDGDLSECDAFDAFILSLADDENNRVYLFDSVMRLASTVGYGGFGAAEYDALRAYGMAERPAAAPDATLRELFSLYPLGADGKPVPSDLPQSVLQDYLAARARKLTLTAHFIEATKDLPQFRLLIGIDDSSNADNIQQNELAYIREHLGENGTLLAGLDSLARLLIARMEIDSTGTHIRTALRWFGGCEDLPSSEFDRYTLLETAELYLRLFDAETVAPEDADLQILLMTAPADETKKSEYVASLLAALTENAEKHVPTVLVEASNAAYGDELENALYENARFASLLGYAGKYDQAVVTGVAFAMGFSRYLCLIGGEGTEASDEAQVRQLANSMALTRYILCARYPLNLYIESLGYDFNNLHPNRADGERITEKLDALFGDAAVCVEENLSGSPLPVSLSPYAERTVESVSVGKASFPWQRTFEISFPVEVRLA